MRIKMPIYIYLKDTGELLKYDTLEFASSDIEIHDIDNYEAFDREGHILKIFQKGQYGKVGFIPTEEKTNKLNELIKNELHFRGFDIYVNNEDDLSNLIESEESRQGIGISYLKNP